MADQFDQVPETPMGSPMPSMSPSQTQSVPQADSPQGQFSPEVQQMLAQEAQQAKYGGVGSQVAAGLEGAGEGALGPVATGLESMYVDPEDIKGRAEANPITHGVGQAVGLGAGLMTGAGEAAVMEAGGKMAMEATGLTASHAIAEAGTQAATAAMAGGASAAEATQAASAAVKAAQGATSYSAKVGSEIVKQAAEMAVLQSGDEASKAMLDPEYSAESAMGEIGLAAALGGATGGLFQGVVSPLWSATAGPALDKGLNMVRNHFDGTAGQLTEGLDSAVKGLNLNVDPMMNSVISGDATAVEHAKTLRYAQNETYMAAESKLKEDVSNSVMSAANVPAKELEVYDEAGSGTDARDALKSEIKAKYAPQEEALDARNKFAEKVDLSDESRLTAYGKMYENAMTTIGTDSPHFKLVEDWGNRFLAKDTAAQLDGLRTELNNDISAAFRSGDTNKANALKNIHQSMGDYVDSEITRQAASSEGARDAILARKMTSADYRSYANMQNELMDHLGVGRFKGTGSLLSKIESISPEQFLNKVSAKNNAEIIPFLQKNFPDLAEHMRASEFKRLIKPAVQSVDGEAQINVEKLSKIMTNAKAGKAGYVDFVFPKSFQDAVSNAKTVLDAIPKTRDSGTAGGLAKILKGMPSSATAMIGMMAGHNPLVGGLLGHLGEMLGRDVPDALRLAHLQFLGSNAPVKAEGFKAATDFLHASMTGQNQLLKSTKAVFTAGKDVLTASRIPDQKDRDKLDKQVTTMTQTPNKMYSGLNDSHLGHYLPDHQASSTEATGRAVQYLSTLKPQPAAHSPLDRPTPVSSEAQGRYNRALDIGTNPHIVLQHIKDGSLHLTDIQDLGAMYPATYKKMAQELSNQMTNAHSDKDIIPYKTRISLSMFLGQPLDTTMTPESLQAIQQTYSRQAQMRQSQPEHQQGQAGKPNAKAGTMMAKGANSYQTATQQAEADRSSRS